MTLYRTYRPQRFADLIGQETAVTILRNAVAERRLAHAYLFGGPRGTGKTTTARLVARAASCLSPVTKDGFEPCGTCANCEAVSRGHATDIVEIDAASNRGIEDVRSLREQAQYPPTLLPYRVYIIDEAHMLTGDAFNALLKTLEEPPAHCLFILATTELHKLPATVRSRCQLIRFERGSVEQISRKLKVIAEQENLTVDVSTLNLVAHHADGGFRDAETLLEQLATQHGPQLNRAAVLATLGSVETEDLDRLLQACLSQDAGAVRAVLDEAFQSPDLRYGTIITELISRLRGLPPAAVTLRLSEKLLEAYVLQRQTPIPSLPLELACLSICSTIDVYEKSVPEPPLSHTVRPLPKARLSEAPVPAAKVVTSPAPAAPTSVPVIELHDAPVTKDVRKAWKAAAEELAAHHLLLAQMVRQASVHTAEPPVLTVHVRFRFHLEKLDESRSRSLVEEALARLTGSQWSVRYELNQSMPRHQAPRTLGQGGIDSGTAAAVFQ